MRILFIDSSAVPDRNIGLAYVATSVKNRHTIKVMAPFSDIRYDKYEKSVDRIHAKYAKLILNNNFIKEAKKFSPEAIGFSVTSFTFQRSILIAEILKPIFPEVRFVWGGIHVTLLPEEVIHNPLVDAICIGDGERSLTEYLNKLEEGRDPEVNGIWYKAKNGDIIKNEPRPFEENLDSLPFPDWELLDSDSHLRKNVYFLPHAIKMICSRGCPYNCTFCSNAGIRDSVPGRHYRRRSPGNVISEIKHNEQRYYIKGFRNIHFTDEIFGLDTNWLAEFCDKFQEEGLDKKFSWDCFTRADVVTKEWARSVAETGCKWVWLGVESGDEYIRRVVYRKNISNGEIARATLNLKENRINVGFFVMLGCPQESIKSAISTVKLIFKAKPANFYYFMYTPLPKTELAKSVNDGMWIRDKKFENYWNIPRVVTYNLGVNKLYLAVYLIHIFKISVSFLTGLRLKGPQFILDLLKYLFLGFKEMGLRNPNLLSYLELKTIYEYSLREKDK